MTTTERDERGQRDVRERAAHGRSPDSDAARRPGSPRAAACGCHASRATRHQPPPPARPRAPAHHAASALIPAHDSPLLLYEYFPGRIGRAAHPRPGAAPRKAYARGAGTIIALPGGFRRSRVQRRETCAWGVALHCTTQVGGHSPMLLWRRHARWFMHRAPSGAGGVVVETLWLHRALPRRHHPRTIARSKRGWRAGRRAGPCVFQRIW